MDIELLASAIEGVLSIIKPDWKTDPNIEDTPTRWAKAFAELLYGEVYLDAKVDSILDKTFPTDYNEMVVIKDIETVGVCPHHLLPIFYTMTIGYIPSPLGQVVGLSKIPRLAALLSARLVLQEQLATDISDRLVSKLKPLGVGVIINGNHGCMSCRGIRSRSISTITTKLYGVMQTNATSRQEFMSYYDGSSYRP